jgi:hypothetical protein
MISLVALQEEEEGPELAHSLCHHATLSAML